MIQFFPDQVQVSPIPTQRYPTIDFIRGTAIVCMVIYHSVFDLDYFHVVDFDFNRDLFWLSSRSIIVSMFLIIVGISLYLFKRGGANYHRYFRRLALLFVCSCLVSLGSYLMFPRSMIFFGVLHFITVASILGLAFVEFYRLNLVAGIMVVISGLVYENPLFNRGPWQWVGFMTQKPVTEDYVPLFPWFGVVLIGIFLGKWIHTHVGTWFRYNFDSRLIYRALVLGGRHSLLIYMVHQPILLGILYLILDS